MIPQIKKTEEAYLYHIVIVACADTIYSVGTRQSKYV